MTVLLLGSRVKYQPIVVQLVQSSIDFVIYDAGSDVHVDDALGRLSITMDGLYRRDYGVTSRIRKAGLPCATVIGGGYDRDRAALAEAALHALVRRRVEHEERRARRGREAREHVP